MKKQEKGKIFKIILLILGIIILIGIGVYFIFFYNKTIVYKCSNDYNPGIYSTERLDRKTWSCRINGIYSCKDCQFDNSSGEYISFKQLREGEKKNVVSSYNYVVFNSKTKKKIAIIEKAYPDNSPFIYNDGKLTAIKLEKYDDDGNSHSIIYNLNKNKETIVLNNARGFHSRRYVFNLNDREIFNSKDNELDEININNNIIIATEYGGKNDDIFDDLLFGLVNIDTGEVVVPIENSTLYRTQYGNFIGTIDTDRGSIIRLYDANGELKYEQGLLVPNPAFVVEDAGNNSILVDNLINYNSKYFELMDYNGKSISDKKIYWSDIISELLKQIKKSEYSDKYNEFNDNTIMSAYKVGNFRIAFSYANNGSNYVDENIKYITFSFYDSESVSENNTVYKPLIASVTYELNITENSLKLINDQVE